MNWLKRWFYRYVAQGEDVVATLAFLKNGPKGVARLTQVMLDRKEPFLSVSPYHYVGAAGLIRIEDDIYGFEVTIGHHHQLLDCTPSAYGLTRKEADPLYYAILSNVPGSTMFEKKMLKNRSTDV